MEGNMRKNIKKLLISLSVALVLSLSTIDVNAFQIGNVKYSYQTIDVKNLQGECEPIESQTYATDE